MIGTQTLLLMSTMMFAAGAAMPERVERRKERGLVGRIAPRDPSGDRAHGYAAFLSSTSRSGAVSGWIPIAA